MYNIILPCWKKKQHMLVRYVLKHGSWFKLVLSWFKLVLSCSWAGSKQLAHAQDQLINSLQPAHCQLRTSLNQLKQDTMLENISNQHMLFFFFQKVYMLICCLRNISSYYHCWFLIIITVENSWAFNIFVINFSPRILLMNKRSKHSKYIHFVTL